MRALISERELAPCPAAGAAAVATRIKKREGDR